MGGAARLRGAETGKSDKQLVCWRREVKSLPCDLWEVWELDRKRTLKSGGKEKGCYNSTLCLEKKTLCWREKYA